MDKTNNNPYGMTLTNGQNMVFDNANRLYLGNANKKFDSTNFAAVIINMKPVTKP